MAGIKIVNILKDDTFQDILELFRRTDASEVIFVLPKNGKVFRSEDHFAAFASEASTGGKTISILANNDRTATLAHKYQFRVMSSGKSSVKRPKAILATQPLPGDDDEEFNQNVLDDDIDLDANPNASQDEKMGRVKADPDADPDKLDGMHIEDEDGPVAEKLDTDSEEEGELVSAGKASPQIALAASGVVKADLDYIDTMWRQKAREQAPEPHASVTPRHAAVATRGRTSKMIMGGMFASALVVLAGVVYMTTGSAAVVVTPVAHALDTQLTVQVSDQFASIDSDFGNLPGQLFNVTKTADQDAPATGQRDVASKARGKITVYNEYSTSPQPLVATTRFTSSTGLVFRTLQSITVPGMTVTNGKTTPGSITVDLIADKPGTSYNVAPGTFTIAAFQEKGDTDRAAKIYGQSTLAFSGGASGPSKVVTQSDYDAAKAGAVKAVTDQIKSAFAQQGGDLVLLDDIQPQITSTQSTAQPDDSADKVTVTATGALQTVAFRSTDLAKLISQSILKKDREVVIPDKLTLAYSNVTFKSDTGILSFTVSIKGTGYAPLDQQKITSDIEKMGTGQIHDYFMKLDGVDSATVSLSPFWVRNVPQKADRIHLQVNYAAK